MTMSRSVRIYEFGGPEVLRIEEVPVVVPVSGEVRLRIHAIGVNRTELKGVSVRASSLLRQLAKGGCAARRLSWERQGFPSHDVVKRRPVSAT